MNDVWAWITDLPREGLMLTSVRLGKLLDEIENFGSLPDNWDGEGANKIHEQTVVNCCYMARCAVDYLTVPDVDPNPNGTVSFEWCTAEGLAYLEVGRTQFSLFVETHGEVVLSLKDEISAHADSIANLFRVISGYLLPPQDNQSHTLPVEPYYYESSVRFEPGQSSVVGIRGIVFSWQSSIFPPVVAGA